MILITHVWKAWLLKQWPDWELLSRLSHLLFWSVMFTLDDTNVCISIILYHVLLYHFLTSITECPWGLQILKNLKWVSQKLKVFWHQKLNCALGFEIPIAIYEIVVYNLHCGLLSLIQIDFSMTWKAFFFNWQVDLLYMNKCFNYHLLTNYNQMFFWERGYSSDIPLTETAWPQMVVSLGFKPMIFWKWHVYSFTRIICYFNQFFTQLTDLNLSDEYIVYFMPLSKQSTCISHTHIAISKSFYRWSNEVDE